MQQKAEGYYHIYNRGVEKRSIFNEERDRWRFLQALALFNNRESYERTLWNLQNREEGANMKSLKGFLSKQERDPLVKIIADCLMDNHYHLLVKEVAEDGMAKFMQKLGTGYTMYFNKKYDREGALFQGNYKSVRVDNDKYLHYLLVYINLLNPAEIIEPNLRKTGPKNLNKIINFAANYRWSTHKEYLGTRDSFIIDKEILGEFFNTPEKYESFCRQVLEAEKYKQVKHLTFE